MHDICNSYLVPINLKDYIENVVDFNKKIHFSDKFREPAL